MGYLSKSRYNGGSLGFIISYYMYKKTFFLYINQKFILARYGSMPERSLSFTPFHPHKVANQKNKSKNTYMIPARLPTKVKHAPRLLPTIREKILPFNTLGVTLAA